MFEVDYFTLDATAVLNRYVVLSGTPISALNVAMDIVGGTAQYLSVDGDFEVDGSKVTWDNTNLALYNQLDVNDRIRVIFDRS
jgi:hypothetical protein